MTQPVALVTDSTCDIPAELLEKYNISIVPLSIVFGSQVYLDGVDMPAVEFYERLARDREHPTTSQPAPQAFLDAYRKAAEDGAREVVASPSSKAMSGTYESARRAAEESPIPVHVEDGRSNSMGIGWQSLAAARVQENGGNLKDMLEAAGTVRRNMVYYITLDTIEYLSKGGRISEAARFLDSVLQIKPMINVRPETGAVGASIPARSRKAALDGLFREFFKHIPTNGKLHLTVLHNNALEEAEAMAERVKAEYEPHEMFISIVSPVLGVHTGPRAVALCGYTEG